MRHLIAAGLVPLSLALLLAFGAGIATTEPASIEAKRAELAQIQSQLDTINSRVEAASEAYNGAQYELGQVESRIQDNETQTAQTVKDLAASRAVLAERLRELYATPEPTLAEVLMQSGSITAAADQLELLDRVGQQDAAVVGNLRSHKAELVTLHKQLEQDRATAAEAVQQKAAQKQKVEGLLAQRKAVYDNASAELKQAINAEKERQRQAAAAAAELARQRAAAAVAPTTPVASSPVSSGSSGSVAPSTPVPSGSGNAGAVSAALSQLGTPYVWGGAAPGGFDCSGLVSWAYAQIGKSVPHYTGAIWSAFPQVSSSDLQPGDLVFFNGGEHVGMYIGGGQFVHAPHTGDVVRVETHDTRGDYVGAVRP
jgi:cell wall-associated NlpC family hydrolase